MRCGRAVFDVAETSRGCGSLGGCLCGTQVSCGLVEIIVLDKDIASAVASLDIAAGKSGEQFGGD